MADLFRPRTLRLVANLSRVRILVGEFEGQRGRFMSFSLFLNGIAAHNGTAHAVTTFHSNIHVDSGLSVNVPASFLRLLHMDESSPFIRISPAGIAYLADPPLQATLPIPPGLHLQALQMYLVLSPPTRIRHQSLMMVAQGHAVHAASQQEELLLVFSSQGGTLPGSANLGIALMKLRSITGGTLPGSANLGIALMKLRSITGTRLPTMMATPLILPLPLLIERINSLFIFNFYFLYFYFPFVTFMFVHRMTFTLVAQAYACYGTSPLNVS
jgi:hypothetical protein